MDQNSPYTPYTQQPPPAPDSQHVPGVPLSDTSSRPLPPAPPPRPTRKRLVLVTSVIIIGLLAASAGIFLWHPWRQSTTVPSQASSSAQASLGSPVIDTASLGAAYDDFYKNGIKDFAPDKKDQTLQAYAALTDGFTLDDTFQKDQTNLLLSLGVAWLAAQDSARTSAYRSEMFLLMSPHLSALPSGITDDQFEPQSSQADKQVLAVFQKYQDTAATSQLKKTLSSSNVLSTVANNLHLPNTDDLSRVHIMVMNFNASDNQAFAQEHNMYGARPTMWAELVGNEPYILLTRDYAQSFIDEPNGIAMYKIEHELVHTQGLFVRGELGRSIEERRAELFSGDHSSYYDVKQLFIYTQVFSGIDMYSLLQQHPTDPNGFYLNLYSTMGVAMANQVVATWPSAFLNQPSAPVKATLTVSGGLNGVIDTAIARGKSDQTAVDKRMEERVQKLMSVFGSKDRVLRDVQNNLGEAYGMPSAATAVETYLNSH